MEEAVTEADRRQTVRYLLIINGVFAATLIIWISFLRSPGDFLSLVGVGQYVPLAGWLVATGVVVAYTAYTLTMLPVVRATALEFSVFRLLAVPVALMSGVVEETVFRKLVMDALETSGYGLVLQTVLSAALFAVVHVVWLIFAKDWRILLIVFASTFVLGIMMSGIYIVSERVVLPAVLAHIVINLVIEPGLLLNATREASRKRTQGTVS